MKRFFWVMERKDAKSDWRAVGAWLTRQEARDERRMEHSWYPPQVNEPKFRIVKYTPESK